MFNFFARHQFERTNIGLSSLTKISHFSLGKILILRQTYAQKVEVNVVLRK